MYLEMPLQDLQTIKALTFDVFGTVVDWRSSVEAALRTALAAKQDSSTLTPHQKEQIHKLVTSSDKNTKDKDWAAHFAQEWRNAYKVFTRSFRAGETPWKDIDTHHHDSLVAQLDRWDLDGLFTPAELQDLSLVWHRLTPWPDAAPGLAQLAELGLVTSTLSNGNRALLSDLNQGEPAHHRAALGFASILSAEDFGAYKPDPQVYLGAAHKLGVAPGQTAMVAAHLNDLDAARNLNLRTVYVERKGEEDWNPSEERYQRAKDWVDLWVGLDEARKREGGGDGGFVEVARQLRGVIAETSGQ